MEYGCIGEHLPHSFSKEIHALIGDYRYDLQELSPEALAPFLLRKEFRGINVTIPYKQAVIPYLDVVEDSALHIGAVNTIVNRRGKLYGYNTDVVGMTALIRRAGLELSGKKVVILGTGGTSRTAVFVAEHLGAADAVRVSRTGREGAVTYENLIKSHTDADVLINTTPCGMYPQPYACPVDPDLFKNLSGVIDAVYNPLRTKLIQAAEDRRIAAAGGLFMLVSQAVAAYELFFEKQSASSLCERIFSLVSREKENIVLIGMPGCGKSTVGKLLAERTGRRFTDTDAMVEASERRPVSEIFSEKGERYFRDAESQAIRETAKASGLVIATGGGAILREENVRNLKMNGKLFFLDRSPARLVPTGDRPLASSREAIEQRYRERYGKYCSCADLRISGDESPEKVAELIMKGHGYENTDY